VINKGLIEQVGSPLELYHRPINQFVAGFIGSPKMNFLPCTLDGAEPGSARVRLSDGTPVRIQADATGLAAGTALTVGIRPEHLLASLTAEGDAAPGLVQVAEHLGDITYLYIQAPSATETLTVKAVPENPLRTGDATRLTFPAEHCYLFGPDGRTLPRG